MPIPVGSRTRLPWLRRFTFDLSYMGSGGAAYREIDMANDDSLTIMSIEARYTGADGLLSHASVYLEIAQRPLWSSPLDAICANNAVLEARIDRLEAAIRALGDHDAALKAAIAQALGATTRTTDPRTIDPPLFSPPRARSMLRITVAEPIDAPLIVHVDVRGIRLTDMS